MTKPACFSEMGGQSGLKAFQGLDRHNLLRQFVPFWYGPRKKCHLPVQRCAGGDVIALVVAVPRAQPALRWLGQVLGVDRDEAMVEFVKDLQTGFLAALLQGRPI